MVLSSLLLATAAPPLLLLLLLLMLGSGRPIPDSMTTVVVLLAVETATITTAMVACVMGTAAAGAGIFIVLLIPGLEITALISATELAVIALVSKAWIAQARIAKDWIAIALVPANVSLRDLASSSSVVAIARGTHVGIVALRVAVRVPLLGRRIGGPFDADSSVHAVRMLLGNLGHRGLCQSRDGTAGAHDDVIAAVLGLERLVCMQAGGTGDGAAKVDKCWVDPDWTGSRSLTTCG